MASPNYNQHPLPAPPQPVQQQLPSQLYKHQPQASQSQKPERTRPKSRAFSFRSDKSQKSAGEHQAHRVDLHETSAEKEAKRLHGKADPRMALNEIEPAMQAQVAGEVMSAPLRSIQHKDALGNPIADPDRSNPTRSRWERPLDTIRSFEAAIDGGYNRKSFYRSDSDSVANWNRRASYYGNNGPRFPQESYYGGRSSTMYDQRQSAMIGGPKESFQGGYDNDPYGNSGMGTRNRYSRMQSEPHINLRGPTERNVYPMPNNHRSYETVASGSGSGSLGEPAGYQTDPTSSENSSIDRRSPPKRQEPTNDYGISFGQSPSYQPSNLGIGDGAAGPPPVPRKTNGTLLRKASKTSNLNGNPQERSGAEEKRKSWFLRRFSKS